MQTGVGTVVYPETRLVGQHHIQFKLFEPEGVFPTPNCFGVTLPNITPSLVCVGIPTATPFSLYWVPSGFDHWNCPLGT